MTSRISLVALLLLALAVPVGFTQQPALQKVTINYPARSGGSWPLFIVKEGGYHQKYGLDATLEFGAGNLGIAAITGGSAGDKLVKEGFFEKTFGAAVKSEQESRSKQAIR